MEVVTLKSTLNQRSYRHAAHCMVWARSDRLVLGTYPDRAAILMQMRFDGMIGFPGGLVDEPVYDLEEDKAMSIIAEGVNRELEEEMKMDKKHRVTGQDYEFTLKNDAKKLFGHFFAFEVSIEDLHRMEQGILQAKDFGNEVMGVFRAVLYTMHDGYRGFPAFLLQNFIPEARTQFLYSLKKQNIMTEEEIQKAIQAGKRDESEKNHPPDPGAAECNARRTRLSDYIAPPQGANYFSEGEDGLTEVWPQGRPLPYPQWADRSPAPVLFQDIIEYEDFAGVVELVSQQTVAAHNYNTIDNFIRFYRAFSKSKINSLEEFYSLYQPPITSCHYTCVGLAYELILRLFRLIPTQHEAHNKFFVVSCEEVIETLESYVQNVPPAPGTTEKEHVLVCLKIEIKSGGKIRRGVILLDPGYHVSRVVTVMEDGLYPHTGKFVQRDDGRVKKEYEYTLVNSNYVMWQVTDTKNGEKKHVDSLIFVGTPFLTAVDIAERRNLMYPFKSLLRRDQKGQLLAGIYVTIGRKSPQFTLFYLENNNKVEFRTNVVKNIKVTKEIRECEFQLGLKKGRLTQIMNAIGKIVSDKGFAYQMAKLEERIIEISADN